MLADRVGRRLRQFELDIGAGHERSVRGQSLGRHLTDPGTGADHDRHTPIQPKQFFVVHCQRFNIRGFDLAISVKLTISITISPASVPKTSGGKFKYPCPRVILSVAKVTATEISIAAVAARAVILLM